MKGQIISVNNPDMSEFHLDDVVQIFMGSESDSDTHFEDEEKNTGG